MRATFQDLGRERVQEGGVCSLPGVSVEGHGVVELSLLPQTQWREVGVVKGGGGDQEAEEDQLHAGGLDWN